MIVRRAVLAGIFLLVAILPAVMSPPDATLFAKAAVFGIIGLSLNILMGYAGQISLGHNAFVGVGAFAAAALTTKSGVPMYISIPMAAAVGGLTATFLGAVALRIQGLYLALITLAYGLVAERSIFGIQELTGGGAGIVVSRPDPFTSDNVFAYVCLLALGAVLFFDWRMMQTKFGRALLALKSNELVASSFGMNPVFFKMGAFIVAGALAGLGGGLLAFSQGAVVSQDFTLLYPPSTALIYIIMVVIGGLGDRLGVVIGSVFTAYLTTLLTALGSFLSKASWLPGGIQEFGNDIAKYQIAITATLLLVTITLFPGGIGQQLKPVRTWLSGQPWPKRMRKPRRGLLRRGSKQEP